MTKRAAGRFEGQWDAEHQTWVGQWTQGYVMPLALLKGKGDVTASSGMYGQNSFPLTGSSKAIAKVLASCTESGGAEAD